MGKKSYLSLKNSFNFHQHSPSNNNSTTFLTLIPLNHFLPSSFLLLFLRRTRFCKVIVNTPNILLFPLHSYTAIVVMIGFLSCDFFCCGRWFWEGWGERKKGKGIVSRRESVVEAKVVGG
ncbi:hypothetical protein QL285_041684 [Trifolium repens]|nr:hypothetical protein QL285_041684 [Trifolium repens]